MRRTLLCTALLFTPFLVFGLLTDCQAPRSAEATARWSHPPTGEATCDVQTRLTAGQIRNNEVDFPWAYVNLTISATPGVISPSSVNIAPSAPASISITDIPAGTNSVIVTGEGDYYAAFGSTPLEHATLVPFVVVVTDCAATTTTVPETTVPETTEPTTTEPTTSTAPTTTDPAVTTTQPAPTTTIPSVTSVPGVPGSPNGTVQHPPAALTDPAPAPTFPAPPAGQATWGQAESGPGSGLPANLKEDG